MSFPRLVLSGSVANANISAINVVYDNDGGTVTKPAKLTRLKYDIKRQMNSLNVSGGTGNRYPNVPYNAVRLIHTWTGYIDVITASVGVFADSTTSTELNLQLMKNAVVLTSTNGVNFTLPTQTEVGPSNPSLDMDYDNAYEVGLGWRYNQDGETESNTTFWMIKDTNITDNQNGTSRVTFTFEFIGIWQRISTIIEANTP